MTACYLKEFSALGFWCRSGASVQAALAPCAAVTTTMSMHIRTHASLGRFWILMYAMFELFCVEQPTLLRLESPRTDSDVNHSLGLPACM